MSVICLACDDYRFVCTHADARRSLVAGQRSQVYPCPVCGPFVNDADGSRYGTKGKRYGNPFLTADEDYAAWRARNITKDPNTIRNAVLVSDGERGLAAGYQGQYPEAKPEWVRSWFAGNRRVQPQQEA